MKRFLVFICTLVPLAMLAQSPSVDPVGTYYVTNTDGTEETGDVNGQSLSAPVRLELKANPSDLGDYTARYEWRVWKSDDPSTILLQRFEEDTEYTFTGSGSYVVQLYATFINGLDTIPFPGEDGDGKTITFSISESKLEFPNAFSPNGDGYNDVLKAKSTYQSIVSFEAAVFSRWGKKLYSWTNINEGWDGKIGGKAMSDGICYLVVHAKGADGKKYNIRKTITVVTGYNNGEGTATGDE